MLALYVLLGTLFAAGVWYKYAYDLRESAGGCREAAKQWAQVMQVMPGLVLGFLEVTILTSISVAISTRLPMLANLVVCILIFFLGHLSPVLVELAAQNRVNELVGFMAQVLCVGPPVAGVLQRRPVDLDRCGHSLVWLRFAGRWAIACCTVEQRCYLRSCCSKTATWPDPPVVAPSSVLAWVPARRRRSATTREMSRRRAGRCGGSRSVGATVRRTRSVGRVQERAAWTQVRGSHACKPMRTVAHESS